MALHLSPPWKVLIMLFFILSVLGVFLNLLGKWIKFNINSTDKIIEVTLFFTLKTIAVGFVFTYTLIATLWIIAMNDGAATSVITNASGAVVDEQRYYPFGETRLTMGTIFTDKLCITGQREMTQSFLLSLLLRPATSPLKAHASQVETHRIH